MLVKHPHFELPFQTNLVQICYVQENPGGYIVTMELIKLTVRSYNSFPHGEEGEKQAEKLRDEVIDFINEKNKADYS